MFAEWVNVDRDLAIAIGSWDAAALLGMLVEQEWKARSMKMVDDWGAFKISPPDSYYFRTDEQLFNALRILVSSGLIQELDEPRRTVTLFPDNVSDEAIDKIKKSWR